MCAKGSMLGTEALAWVDVFVLFSSIPPFPLESSVLARFGS